MVLKPHVQRTLMLKSPAAVLMEEVLTQVAVLTLNMVAVVQIVVIMILLTQLVTVLKVIGQFFTNNKLLFI